MDRMYTWILLVWVLISAGTAKVAVGDGLPAQLCLQCVHQISRCHAFKELVERNDITLREHAKFLAEEAAKELSPRADTSNDNLCEWTYNPLAGTYDFNCDHTVNSEEKEVDESPNLKRFLRFNVNACKWTYNNITSTYEYSCDDDVNSQEKEETLRTPPKRFLRFNVNACKWTYNNITSTYEYTCDDDVTSQEKEETPPKRFLRFNVNACKWTYNNITSTYEYTCDDDVTSQEKEETLRTPPKFTSNRKIKRKQYAPIEKIPKTQEIIALLERYLRLNVNACSWTLNNITSTYKYTCDDDVNSQDKEETLRTSPKEWNSQGKKETLRTPPKVSNSQEKKETLRTSPKEWHSQEKEETLGTPPKVWNSQEKEETLGTPPKQTVQNDELCKWNYNKSTNNYEYDCVRTDHEEKEISERDSQGTVPTSTHTAERDVICDWVYNNRTMVYDYGCTYVEVPITTPAPEAPEYLPPSLVSETSDEGASNNQLPSRWPSSGQEKIRLDKKNNQPLLRENFKSLFD